MTTASNQDSNQDPIVFTDDVGWTYLPDILSVDEVSDLAHTCLERPAEIGDERGATRLVPGSHRRVDLQRFSGNLDNHPDEMVLTGRAGGMFVFSRHVLHSETTNRSTAPRPALQSTWARARP